MPPTNACPRCGRPSPSNVKFCPSCGSTLSVTSGGRGWKLILGAVALFAGLVWVAALFARPQTPTQLAGASQPQALAGPVAGLSAPQATPQPSLTLTSAQHLAEARRALADGYKPNNKDPRKASWGEVAAAKWHLKVITAAEPEYREAQELLKEVARRERQIESAKKQVEREDAAEGEDADSDATAEADYSAGKSSPASSTAPAYSAPSASTATRQTPPASTTDTGEGSSSDYYTNSRGNKVHRPVFSENGPPAGATAQCRDGSYSFSQSRRGTCSHHGGVSRWF